MPFLNSASPLVIIFTSLLVYYTQLVWSAPPPGSIQAPTNVSALNDVNTTVESDLLDGTKLPFMATCDAETIDVVPKKLCELYGVLTSTVLTKREPKPVAIDEVRKVISEKVDARRFCDNLVRLLINRKMKHLDLISNSPLKDELVCDHWCLVMSDDQTKAVGVESICKVLLWGLQEELASEHGTVEQNPVDKVANVIIPPLLPKNVEIPAVEKKDVESKPEKDIDLGTKPEIGKPTEVPSGSKVNVTESLKKSNALETVSSSNAVIENAELTNKTENAENSQPKQNDDPFQSDLNEYQNQNNIRDINSDGNINNELETGDDFSEEDQFDQESVLPKESPVKDDIQLEQDLPNGGDSDGFSVEQPAAAAVQIERVDPFFDQEDSNFFSYFMFVMFACIVCYVVYHNKSKLVALLVEGRRSNSGRGGFSKGGRKHTAAYRKLDSNLEEAITSNASASSRSTSQIIY